MSKIIISGEISSWGFGAAWLREKLASIQGDVTVEISSYGGDVYESIDMYNLLRQHSVNKGKVTTLVGSKAMSGGAIITMAGDERMAHENSTFMIHRAWTFTWGNAEDLKQEASILDGIDRIQAKEFAKYLPEDEEEVMSMFTKDTYYIGKDQLESTGIFTNIISEPLAEDTIESQKQATNAFASAKKDFQTQVEKNNYVPDFAKVAKSVAATLATMPSGNEKIVNSKAGDSMEFNENNFKILQARVAQRDEKIALLEDDKELLATKLDKTNAALEATNEANASLTDKLSEAKAQASVVTARLGEAVASKVSAETAQAMVNASSDDEASKLALNASGDMPIDSGDIGAVSTKKDTGMLAYAELNKGSVK